jgi:hypothetical protein
MTPTFTLKRGDTWNQSFTWRQGSETGDPVDLTGCTARMQVRDRSDVLILDCTPYLALDELAGTVSVLVPASETELFPVAKNQFDIELTFPDGTVQSTETMILRVIEDVTLP